MAGNGYKLLEIARTGCMAWNGLEWLEMDEMARNELGMAGMAGNGWRWLKRTGLPGNTWYG